MAYVTIEGSVTTPSTFLAPRARITVERTTYIDKLIARGYVNVIERITPEAAADEVEQATECQREAAASEHALTGAPPRNGRTEEWAKFLESKGYRVDPAANRDALIAAWDAIQKESADGGPATD